MIEVARPQSAICQRKGPALIIDCVPQPPRYTICRFSQGTFAGTPSNGREAPIPDLRALAPAAVVLIAVALSPAIFAAADPAAVINNLANRVLEVLGKSPTPAQKLARFQELFRADFDVPGIARFVLGRYWKTATPEQQEEFVKLFEDHIALVYSSQLAAYSGETLKVTGSRPGPEGVIVASEIVRPTGAPPVKVEWHLTDRNGAYKINDVVVDGISMAVTQRSEFAAVIQRNGGQVQGLITQLREKDRELGVALVTGSLAGTTMLLSFSRCRAS
jgi:phospholipid transport system substrate-binding protein